MLLSPPKYIFTKANVVRLLQATRHRECHPKRTERNCHLGPFYILLYILTMHFFYSISSSYTHICHLHLLHTIYVQYISGCHLWLQRSPSCFPRGGSQVDPSSSSLNVNDALYCTIDDDFVRTETSKKKKKETTSKEKKHKLVVFEKKEKKSTILHIYHTR